MSKILITGNGFDLFHHLPTKYGHFISIMETIEKNQFDKDAIFNDLFGDVFKKKFLLDFESIFSRYNVDRIIFNYNKINELKRLLSDNVWFKHFKNVIEIDTWIDFEIEIENILNQLIVFEHFKDKWDIKNNIFVDKYIHFNDLKSFQLFEITNEGDGFILKEKYINRRVSSVDIKEIISDLAKSFEDFIIIFNRYLVDLVGVFYAEIKQNESIPFQLMDEIYTFNYTPSLEKFYKIDTSKVVYLHGEINEDDNIQNIVLGISEMPKHIKTSKMYDFTKYYQKVNKKSNKKFIDVPIEPKNNRNVTVFYIMGHSLNESDKEYINDLFNFLKFDKNKHSKICVFYYNKKDKEDKLKNLFSILDNNIVVEMEKVGRLYFVELNNKNILAEFNRTTYTRS